MGEVSNTLEQRNTSQANTIAKQVQQIKDLKQQVSDLSIWQRFVEYLVTDCNMQPEVLEESMGVMLERESQQVKKPVVHDKRPIHPSSYTTPAYWAEGESINHPDAGWYSFARIPIGTSVFGPYATEKECVEAVGAYITEHNTPAS